MAGPGIRISGAGDRRLGGAETRGDDLWQLFHMAISQPSQANERLFAERYRAMNPHSTLFGGGGAAGANVAQLNSAAAQLSGAAARLMTAAAQLSSAAGASRLTQMAAGNGSAHLARLVGQRLDIPSAYAGGGAGRRGGVGSGGGGGGWGRLGRFPSSFPAGGLLNAAMDLGGAAPIMAPIIGITALAYEAMRAPIQLSHIERGFANEAMPFHNLANRTYALGRAGGFSGANLTRRLFPGHYVVPPWMAALGIGPEDAADALSEYGIVPRSADAGASLPQNLIALSKSPAFAGMPQSQIIGFQRQMAGLGIGGQGTLDPFTVRVAGIMEQAIAKGMDRATVLRSIQSGISRMSGGGSVSANAMADFFANTQGLGPGFRTGESQLGVLGNIAQAASRIGTNSPITTLMANEIGRVHSHADLARLFGARALAEAEHDNPAVRLAERHILQASRLGSPGLAFGDMRFLMSNSVLGGHAMMRAVTRMRGGKFDPNDLLSFDLLQGLGLNYKSAVALALGGHGGTKYPSHTMDFLSGGHAINLAYTGAGNSDVEAIATARHLSPELVDAIERSAQLNGVDPRVLLAEAFKESHFKNNKTNYNGPGKGTDYGYFQINSRQAARMGVTNVKDLTNPYIGAYLAGKILSEGGIQGYNPHDPNERSKFTTAYQQLFPNYNGMPPTNPMVANAGQADLTAAYTSFKEFGEHLATWNTYLVKAADGLKSLDDAVTAVTKSFRAIMSPNQPAVPGL